MQEVRHNRHNLMSADEVTNAQNKSALTLFYFIASDYFDADEVPSSI